MRRRLRMPAPALLLALSSLVPLATACSKAPEPALPQPVAAAAPAAPVVTDEGGPYLLRYFSPTTGHLIVARKVAEVPADARGQVLVVPDDAALQGPWIFVADLTQKGDAGYLVQRVDRFELEAEFLRDHPPPPAKVALGEPSSAAAPGKAGANAGDVVLYKTAWCGYCKKAAKYLELKGVPFVTRDLERDAGARDDMMARARQAGFPSSRLSGVPVIWIKGKILTGFSREAIDAALGG